MLVIQSLQELARSELSQLQQGLQTLASYESELKGSRNEALVELHENVSTFRGNAVAALKDAGASYDQASRAIVETHTYFGDVKMKPSELFTRLYNFIKCFAII